MQVIKSRKIICFDCDDTLVLWNDKGRTWGKNNKDCLQFRDPYIDWDYFSSYLYLKPNTEVVDLVKKYKAAGWTVIVWSAGGGAWAEEVVNVLKLNEFVDIAMSKPEAYVDDNDSTCWMGTYIAITLGGKIVHPELIDPEVMKP